MTAAIVRRARSGDLEPQDAEAALATLEEEILVRFSVIEVKSPTLTRAVDLVKAHALKAADAIQLACALAAASGKSHDEFRFVCADVAFNDAAEAEGLRVLDPTDAS